MAKRDTVTVAVTGQSDWQVLSVRRGFNGNRSEAYIRVPDTAYEDFETEFDPDTVYEITFGGTTIFKGHAIAPGADWGGSLEACEVVLVGPEWDLERCFIFGQRAEPAGGLGGASEYPIMTGLKAVFNPDGVGNMGDDGSIDSDKLFAPYPNHPDSESWTALDIVKYLAQIHTQLIGSDAQNTVFDDPSSLTLPSAVSGEVLPSVRAHGLTVKDAFTQVLKKLGCGWCLTPQAGASNMYHDLVVFQRGNGTSPKNLQLPARDSALSGVSNPEYTPAAGHLVLDHGGVASKTHGHSGAIIYEDTFTLLKGWSETDQNAAFGSGDTKQKVSNLMKVTSQDGSRGAFETYKNVGRRYILNETGREDNEGGDTDPYDFSSLFEDGGNFVARPRPFLPHRPGKDQDGNYAEPEIYITDGEHTYGHQKEYEWRLLRDIAGIYFHGSTWPYNAPRAIAKDDPEEGFPSAVKIKAALLGDDTYAKEVTPTGCDLGIDVIQILDFEAKFEAWKIDGGGSQDRSEFDDMVTARADDLKKKSTVGRLNFEVLSTYYEVGDWIGNSTGRVIEINAHVVGIRWDCETQMTEIYLESLTADVEHQVESKAPRVWRQAVTMIEPETGKKVTRPRYRPKKLGRLKVRDRKLLDEARRWSDREIGREMEDM